MTHGFWVVSKKVFFALDLEPRAASRADAVSNDTLIWNLVLERPGNDIGFRETLIQESLKA